MDGRLRAKLEALIEAMPPKERRKLAQRAERDRREARQQLRRARGRSGFRGPGPQPDAPLQDWMLVRLSKESEAPSQSDAATQLRRGQVVSLSRRWATVLPDTPEEGEPELLQAGLPLSLAQSQRAQIAVGDQVRFGLREGGRLEVGAVLPRRTRLERPDPADALAKQVLVANVDLVFIVIAAKDPEPRTGLIDRFLVGIAQGGAQPVLCVNKVDLLDAAELEALELLLAPYEALGLSVLRCSAKRDRGLDPLRAAMAGKQCVFVGHSGVGKSSLVNALAPEATQATGEINEVVGKGRHTTTVSQLIVLDDGSRLIDTPGLRAFGLWRIDPVEARGFFPDLTEPGARCRYRDCLHVDEAEAECGVKLAVRSGELPEVRYLSYLRIVESLRSEG